jgi:hypothetical protein
MASIVRCSVPGCTWPPPLFAVVLASETTDVVVVSKRDE